MRFADHLKFWQRRSGKSWYRIAKEASLSYNAILGLRDGTTENPKLDSVRAIATAVGTTLEGFFNVREREMNAAPPPNSEASKVYFLGKTPLVETERRGWARALLGTEDVTQADEDALARLVAELDETERLLVSRALDVLADHAERLAPPEASEPAKPRAKTRRRAR